MNAEEKIREWLTDNPDKALTIALAAASGLLVGDDGFALGPHDPVNGGDFVAHVCGALDWSELEEQLAEFRRDDA